MNAASRKDVELTLIQITEDTSDEGLESGWFAARRSGSFPPPRRSGSFPPPRTSSVPPMGDDEVDAWLK